jgi:NAD(P)-dependent dehydrogenase (short-subunit alcohol dehydrogenase family)
MMDGIMACLSPRSKAKDACTEHLSRPLERNGVMYSMPDQVARFANANATGDPRYLDITTVYDGSSLKGKRILITGAEQGLGLELVKEIIAQGGVAVQAGRTSSTDLDAVAEAHKGSVEIILGVDVTKDEAMTKMAADLKEPVDIVINCAGYFYGPAESVGVGCEGHMNFKQQMLQIDICALGPLRITHALYKAGKIKEGGKVIIITSQAGSCEWRFTQNPTPKPGDEFHGNYGHHMSRAATNIMGVILSQELKAANIPIQMLHPGFNRTAMTQKYAHIWDIEGAVEPEIGAKRVLYETIKADMSTSGTVINCEDGLRIPW